MNITYQNNTRSRQEDIYRNLYRQHKGTPMAVSSESLAHKELRFRKISEIFAAEDVVQVHDVGMGLGDAVSFIREARSQYLILSGSHKRLSKIHFTWPEKA
ncbi:MAG: hypothetical protein LC660_08625 [Desulfobacteraceae bacterium]|nr:hypothetical protein [Desulfobacteraceae bacterium]